MSDCPRCKNPLRDCICGSEADKETLAFFVREYESAKQNEVTILEREVSDLQSQLAARDAEIADLRAAHELVETAHENRIERDLKIIAERDAEIAAMRPVVESCKELARAIAEFEDSLDINDAAVSVALSFRDYESKDVI